MVCQVGFVSWAETFLYGKTEQLEGLMPALAPCSVIMIGEERRGGLAPQASVRVVMGQSFSHFFDVCVCLTVCLLVLPSLLSQRETRL